MSKSKHKRRPFVVVKDAGLGLTLYTLMVAADRKGCQVEDLFGKRLAFTYKVGKRKKIKSLRIFKIWSEDCELCGPHRYIAGRLGGEDKTWGG